MKAGTNEYQVIVTCEDCKIADIEQSSLQFALGYTDALYLVHSFSWNFKEVWSKELDEDDNNLTPYSSVSGYLIPHKSDGDFGQFLGGPYPSKVNLMLTRSQYTSLLDYSEATGYRVNL